MKENRLTTIAPQPRRTTGEVGMARSQLYDMIPTWDQSIIRMGNRGLLVQYGGARHSLYIEALIAGDIGLDSTALRRVLTSVASLPAGRPATTFGY
eukprot:5239240-Pyramimonas_sp.AAC.1